VTYEQLTQLVVDENPYGDFVTTPMVATAVTEVKEELDKLRAKADDPKTTAEELAELERALEYVDGPAAKYQRKSPVPNPAQAAALAKAKVNAKAPGAAPDSQQYGSALHDAFYDAFMKGLFWNFKGKAIRISKAIRLEYEYEEAGAAPGQPKKTYSILIGFEGAGGGM
jgi:hypothetical protein